MPKIPTLIRRDKCDVSLLHIVIVMLVSLMWGACNVYNNKYPTDINPPFALKKPKSLLEYNNQRIDAYYWLKNAKDTNVVNLLKAENAYADKMLTYTEPLRQKLMDEIIGRTQNTFKSAPIKSRGYWYYNRLEAGRDYPIYCRKKENWNAREEILLNVDKMAKGYAVFRLNQFQVSPDNNFIAYQLDTAGDRNYVLYIKDLRTDEIVEKSERNVNSDGFFWANDSQTLFYIQNDEIERGYRVMQHKLNQGFEKDKYVYEERDSSFWVTLNRSRSRKFLFVASESSKQTEIAYINIDKPDDLERRVILPRQKNLLYYVNHFSEDSIYIMHNFQAPNFKLSRASLSIEAPVDIYFKDTTSVQQWTEVIPHNDSSLLMKYEVLDNYIVYQNRIDASIKINIVDRTTNQKTQVAFDEEIYNTEFYLADYDNSQIDSIRFYYQSLKTPLTTYSYNISSQKKVIIAQNDIENYITSKYVTKRLWAQARDGANVPISIVYKKGSKSRNGQNPLLLTAYGAYGSNFETDFSPEIISLLDRGFTYAIAHVRGGQELGNHWYEKGKTIYKKNTFYDFIDCAEFLIQNKYVARDKLCADGVSAGGLLLAVAINERPDLWRAVTPDMPWTDVITDALDSNLPLVSLEVDEWGDIHKKDNYDYMLSWSPYDNIKKAYYPAILTNSALLDTQVPFYSPFKWSIKLRDNNLSSKPIIHRCLFVAGHSGPSARYERMREVAIKYAFILNELGIRQ